MIINLDITFKTPVTLTQEDGQQLWMMAMHFAASGPSTYRIQMMEAGTDMMTIVNAATEWLRELIATRHPELAPAHAVEFVSVAATVNEAAVRLWRATDDPPIAYGGPQRAPGVAQ